MRQKFTYYLKFVQEYFFINISGLFGIYKIIFGKLIKRLSPFSIKEYVYYFMILCTVGLTGTGWRSYEIVINDEIVHHSIASNDFLIFLMAFFIMGIPAMIKFIFKYENHRINVLSLFIGLSIATIVYVMNFFNPTRILATPEASFTIWFYLFGLNLLLLWIIGVLGILPMPSTRLKS